MPYLKTLLLAWAVVQTGCSTCTEIGCSDAAMISYSSELPDGEYRVDIVTDDATASCTLELDDDRMNESCSGTLDDVTISNFDIAVRGTNKNITVTILDSDDRQIANDAFVLDYEKSRPNGPGCPPLCRQAQADLEIEAISSSNE